MKKQITFLIASLVAASGLAQDHPHKFDQLKQEFATPGVYRTASGAPGHLYWQQQADYTINILLDDEHQRLYGDEVVTYTNNSPDVLNYLWVQLDQQAFEHGKLCRPGSVAYQAINLPLKDAGPSLGFLFP